MSGEWATVNASLNAASGVCLVLGWRAIRRGRRAVHERWMTLALIISAIFFLSYLGYHMRVGSVRYAGQGWIRPVYYTLLISHVVLAVAIVPLALRTWFLAKGQRFDRHRRLARITWPLWLYVSISGVVVYAMLYHGGSS